MTVGIASGHANEWLSVFRGTTYTGITAYVKLHTADPGAAGATAASANTNRVAVTWAAASGGSMSMASMASTWTMTTTETITHISIWDAATAGSFEWSIALSAAIPVINGSTLSLTTLTLALSPIAA
jgi:hypothetical protein